MQLRDDLRKFYVVDMCSSLQMNVQVHAVWYVSQLPLHRYALLRICHGNDNSHSICKRENEIRTESRAAQCSNCNIRRRAASADCAAHRTTWWDKGDGGGLRNSNYPRWRAQQIFSLSLIARGKKSLKYLSWETFHTIIIKSGKKNDMEVLESETEARNAVMDVKFRNYIFQYKYNKLRQYIKYFAGAFMVVMMTYVCVPLNNFE